MTPMHISRTCWLVVQYSLLFVYDLIAPCESPVR